MIGLHLVLTVVLFSGPVSGKVTYKLEIEANQKIFQNFRVIIYDDTLNLTADVLRVIEGKIMYKFDLLNLSSNGKMRAKLLDVPKMNYCNVRRNLKTAPLLSNFIEFIDRYGNWTAFCPWKPGLYGIWNAPMDDHFLPMKKMIPNGKYLMTNNITDENGPVQPLVYFKMTITVA